MLCVSLYGRAVLFVSYGVFYCMLGPYTFRGSSSPQMTRGNTSRSFGDTHQAHGRYFQFHHQWFHVWCEFISENNTGIPSSSYYRYRDSWMTYMHYMANGDMADDWNYLNLHGVTGVGQYDAAWTRIEAEWYMTGTDIDKIQILNHPGDPATSTHPPTGHVYELASHASSANNSHASFGVHFLRANSSLGFPNVHNLPVQGIFTLHLSLAPMAFQNKLYQKHSKQMSRANAVRATLDPPISKHVSKARDTHNTRSPIVSDGGDLSAAGSGGALVVYIRLKEYDDEFAHTNDRLVLLATCKLSTAHIARVSCPFDQSQLLGSLADRWADAQATNTVGEKDLVFVYEPDGNGTVVLDSWNITAM